MINALNRNIEYVLSCKWYKRETITQTTSSTTTHVEPVQPVLFRAKLSTAISSDNKNLVQNLSTEVTTATIETVANLPFSRDDLVEFEENKYIITNVQRQPGKEKERVVGLCRVKVEDKVVRLSLLKVE